MSPFLTTLSLSYLLFFVALQGESGVLGFPSRRALTPRGNLKCYPEIPAFPGEESTHLSSARCLYPGQGQPGPPPDHGDHLLATPSQLQFYSLELIPSPRPERPLLLRAPPSAQDGLDLHPPGLPTFLLYPLPGIKSIKPGALQVRE